MSANPANPLVGGRPSHDGPPIKAPAQLRPDLPLADRRVPPRDLALTITAKIAFGALGGCLVVEHFRKSIGFPRSGYNDAQPLRRNRRTPRQRDDQDCVRPPQ